MGEDVRGGWTALLQSFDERERWTSLAFVAGQQVVLDEEERNEALRRALVVRAVGGDPHRELTLEEDSVTRLAEELDDPAHRAELRSGLEALLQSGHAEPLAAEVAATLLASPDLAWRAFCAALLAAELGDD
jgi:hypothetical protein